MLSVSQSVSQSDGMGYCKWDIMLHIVQCSDLGCRRTLGTECPSRAAARPNIGARGFGGLPEKILAETLFSFDFSCFYSNFYVAKDL